MLSILGMGHAHPDIILDNKFIEELDIGTNAAWIEEKIGILTRRISIPLDYIKETKNSDPRRAPEVATISSTELGVRAARMAIERAGISPDQIGMVIANCCTPSQTTPGESQRIGKELGLKKVRAFDVFTACPAFALHVDMLNSYKEEALPDYILCLSTATLSQKVDYSDRTAGAIWGDGAAAYILSPRKEGRLKVAYTSYYGDPVRCDAVVVDTYGYFHQDGRAVRNFSVLQTVKLIREIEKKFEIDWSRDVFIGHQANYTMLQQIIKNREIADSNHWHNVRNTGNQAGASAPAVLSENWDNIQAGQKVVVAVVGAGLSWGSLLLES
ncbi:MAG: ketoacyl-ACP synthase III [Deltaproteobacteria bacterium]|nr:ketoacyl-ACP synthase III [Deltaproteobacteria bacterium]